MYRSHSLMALLAAICFLGIACTEAPMDSGDLAGPEFGKGGKPDKPDKPGKPERNPPITVLFTDDVSNDQSGTIISDGRGIYEDGCNVTAMFNLEDAILDLLRRIRKKDEAACGDPRTIHVQFPDQAVEGSPDTKAGWFREMRFINVDHVENVTEADGTLHRMAAFGFVGCAQGLKFKPDESTENITVNDVLVTRIDDVTWNVASQPYPDNVAVCVPDAANKDVEREYYHMAFDLTVTLVEE